LKTLNNYLIYQGVQPYLIIFFDMSTKEERGDSN
jgi:hypothetical protein